MSGIGIKARFAELRLPNGAPPLWAWSVIGVAYYILFFFLLRSVLARPSIPFWTSVALTLTALLLTANASWNWIFFRKKDLWLSFVFFVPYLLLAFTLAGVLYRIRNPLSGWYALYPAISHMQPCGATVFGASTLVRPKTVDVQDKSDSCCHY
jgi:tryptophan-rich sensory protein